MLDTASLIHRCKGPYDFDLFPQGGVHWNDVGGALAVTALVDEINRQAGREIVPPFTFTYTLSRPRAAPTANWSTCSTCSFRRSPI